MTAGGADGTMLGVLRPLWALHRALGAALSAWPSAVSQVHMATAERDQQQPRGGLLTNMHIRHVEVVGCTPACVWHPQYTLDSCCVQA